MPEPNWSLHPQLVNDTMPVGDLPLSRVLAINAADYPWLVLVPRRAGVTEIVELGDDAAALTAEIVEVSRALKDVSRCDKLNIAAIGNIVPQLHVHVVARRKGDPLWPKPVWGAGAPRVGDEAVFERFIAAIRASLAGDARLSLAGRG